MQETKTIKANEDNDLMFREEITFEKKNKSYEESTKGDEYKIEYFTD